MNYFLMIGFPLVWTIWLQEVKLKLDKIEKLGYMNIFPLLPLVSSTVYRLNVFSSKCSPKIWKKKNKKLKIFIDLRLTFNS